MTPSIRWESDHYHRDNYSIRNSFCSIFGRMRSLFLVPLLLFSCNNRSLMTDSVEMKSDSGLITAKLAEINREIGSDKCYNSGEVFHSPDSNFKVMVLSGEKCDEYCTPVYYTEFYIKNRKRWRSPVTVSPVKLIGKIPGTAKNRREYFIVDGCTERPHAIQFTESCHLYHIGYNKGDIEFLPMINHLNDTVFSLPVYFHISTCEPYDWSFPEYDEVSVGFKCLVQEYDPGKDVPCSIRSTVISYREGMFREL